MCRTLLSAGSPSPTPHPEVVIPSPRSKYQAALIAGFFLAISVACLETPSAPACIETALSKTAQLGDTVVLNTGLRYINAGTPSGSPVEWCDPVSVHYTAYLANGTRLESTRDTELPLAFTPGFQDLIDGFEQGVVGLQQNVIRRLIIPPQLGYGSEPVRNNAGVVIIPANSTLIYDVEIATP
jgi:FKBP-type peptidyl-prolyl cis-trans isomerase